MEKRRLSQFKDAFQERRLVHQFRDAFHDTASSLQPLRDVAAHAEGEYRLVQAAREGNLSIDEVRQLKRIFDGLDEDDNGTLEFEEFVQAFSTLIPHSQKEPEEDAKRARLLEHAARHWQIAMPRSESGESGGGGMRCEDFLRWFATVRFNEEMLITEEQLQARKLARKYKVDEKIIEACRGHYNEYDTDGSGLLEIDEFAGLLHKIMKLPPEAQLPTGRVERLWREIDMDRSGFADFEEFVAWWLSVREMLTPYEAFYKQIRNMRPDPPLLLGADGEVLSETGSTARGGRFSRPGSWAARLSLQQELEASLTQEQPEPTDF